MNKRIIKKQVFLGNDIEDINLTKFNLQNKGIKILNKYKVESTNDKLKNIQYNTPIVINEHNIIDIYNVTTYDQLYNWMEENIQFGNIITVKRILNSWIRVNIKVLKKYNNGLAKILDLLVKRYYDDKELLKKHNINSNNYVDYWIDKNINLDFHIDILDDYDNYIEKIILKNK